MINEITIISVGIRVINIVLLSYLLNFYVRNHGKFRSNFTMGLLVFSLLLLIQNISALFFRLALEEDVHHVRMLPFAEACGGLPHAARDAAPLTRRERKHHARHAPFHVRIAGRVHRALAPPEPDEGAVRHDHRREPHGD